MSQSGIDQLKKDKDGPKLKYLNQYITPQHAAHWKDIGTLLDLPSGILDIIEQNNEYKSVHCCNDMWRNWLNTDPSANWEKLFKAIESHTEYSNQIPNKGAPQLKYLFQHFTPHYAAQWKMIGTLLDLPNGTLDIIEQDNVYRSVPCCNAMWKKWLMKDLSASWEKLFKAIESLSVSSDHAPDKATSKPDMDRSTVTDQGVSIMSDRVKELNKQMRFAVDEDAWPPNQPQDFTPLLLIHHKKEHNLKQAAALQMARSIQSGRLHSKHYPQDSRQSLVEVLNNSKTTKQLVDILAPLQDSDDAQFVLVEGLPGIGKTLLLQEIAYNWAIGNLLQKFKIALLVQLRSPVIQGISLVADLLQLVCKRETNAKETATACSEYLFSNKGKDIVFVFDGYDEFPEHLQKDSLVADILKRKVLPHCGLIVSSRPHASVKLRQQATIRIDILGFAEEERLLFIEQSLKEQPHAVKELTEYLEDNLTINGLCFIPFNMVILIHLHKQGIRLPTNPTDLYVYFIYLTISRHLAKSGKLLEDKKDTDINLDNIPEPYNRVVKQLSKLALEGLNNNQLIFTLQEMRKACPDIATIPGSLNGFGLLHAIQHNGLTGKTMTFNFVHFSIQEFLAAYYITRLPPDEELQVLETKFWSDFHSNMFSMYTSLTKGQQLAFKRFLSGGNDMVAISEIFLEDQLKCLRLYRCFREANDEAFYTTVQNAKAFDNKAITLENVSLSPYDVECITLFLACSPHKEWKELLLRGCHIQDHGLRVLYRNLRQSDISIKGLELKGNELTKSSSSISDITKSSSSSISDLAVHCKVEELVLTNNDTIGEDSALYSMLSNPSSSLVTLEMEWTSLTSSSVIILFSAISKGNKLKLLNIS